MSNQGQPEGESSDGSSYIGISQLLNNIARDLDHMLDELGQSSTLPSPCASSQTDEFATAGEERSHYRRATGLPSNQLRIRNSSGDALLEQFVQNLIDSLTLPGSPFDGRSPVQSPDSSLCPLGLSGGGQEVESNGKDWRVDNEEYGEDQPCDISMVERIARTHPVWFLPGITRPGAVHLLQGKDPGNFIVRKSSKNNTMAISVRLPDDKGPYIEHYLIENIGREYRLEGSDNCFEAVPTLVAHYCQCCDELPVQLTLPRAIKQATTRQELSSLAMLGQDYWVSSFATSPTEKTKSHTITSSPVMTTFGQRITVSPPSNNCNAFHSSTTSLTSTTESTSENNTLPTNKPAHPPPPPPRWCKPPPTNNTNITVTTSVSFNLNHNSNVDKKREKEDVRPVNGSPKRPQALIDSKNPKVVRRKKKSTHYTHSNVVDSPPDYYRSSLADKISDYEDIWGAPVKSENTRKQNSIKVELVTFKPSPPPNTASPLPSKRTLKENKDLQENGHKSEGTSMSDASSSKSSPSSTLSSSPSSQSSRLRNKLGLTVATGTPASSSSPNVKKHSSPFYAEPVDSLQSTNGHKTGSTNQQKVVANANRRKVHPKPALLPARLLSHRHSDPNIQWPLAKNGGVLETIYASQDASTPTTTLSSSLDNLNGHRRLTRSRGQVVPSGLVNGGFSPQLVNEHRVMVDMETQTTPSNVTKGRGKAESPKKLHISIPKLIPYKGNNDNSWPVDSSWEWLGNENESQLDDSDLEDEIVTVEELLKKDAKFPLVEFRKENSMDSSSLQCSDRITVEDLIQQKSPDLHVPEIQPLTKSNLLRVSEYDNLDDSRDDNNCPVRSVHERDNLAYAPSESASSMTEFSEPWDSSRWDQILQLINEPQVIVEEEEKEWKENNFNASIEENEKNKMQGKRSVELLSLDVVNEAVMSCNLSMVDDDGTSLSSLPTVDIDHDISHCAQEKTHNFIPSTYIFTSKGKNNGLGDSIREYVLRLSQDKSTTFGKTIENFIQCTLDSHETSPHIVMRNVRQFMSGIKNYLVKHGEGQFEMVVQVERSKLKANEFLNLDAILEGVLHKIVIKPLKKHVYQLFVNEYTKNGALKLLSDNIKYARAKTPEEFGVKPQFTPPKNTAMDTVHHFLRRLQQVYSPMKKLENLLSATACIFSSVQNVNGKEEKSMGADDYLPMLMYVLVHCGMIAAEIEADYMWGLLHPSLLIGEGGYYLTTLSSAVDVLKNFQKCHDDKRREFNSIDTKENEMHGFMKIMIPDELNGSIISKTFPVRPSMSTKEVGKMIAHRFNITNPQDYGLFKLINGEETLLMDAECPHTLHTQLQVAAVDCAFAYKRTDAKIAWPITSKKS